MRHSTRPIAFFVAAVFLVTCQESNAADYAIQPNSDIKKLVKKVVAGDRIVLDAGVWNDCQLTFDRLAGEAQNPITICASQPGKVVFMGKSQLRFSGQYVVLSGLVFRDTDFSDVLTARTHSQRHAHHCRITDCDFVQTGSAPAGSESRWLSLYGTHNRVDHCRFAGKRSRGTTLVVWVDDSANHHQIDHNYFGHRPKLGRNGGETIRIGTSEVAEKESSTTVIDNYFYRCNGESEVVSNKSCGNLYRHNVFDECSGALTLRHGHRCTVDANVFRGNKQSGTGGVRIIGSSHVVTNNYFANLRGDEMRAALSMMNAPPNDKVNGYSAVRNALVAHNTFVDCKVSMEIGVEASEKQNVAPADCRIESNLFHSGKWKPFRIHAQPSGFQWSNNFARTDDRSVEGFDALTLVDFDLDTAMSSPQPPVPSDRLRVPNLAECPTDINSQQRSDQTIVGCVDSSSKPRDWVDAQHAGPTWIAR
ncbi:polysaccharide lyase 6 family protein [Planctomycetes bacterium K23_9]|uniref:Chondroitinase-B n=1 Tax=Stieleria marina TaxID=1930275 RepID=A0A517NWL0_9BACT|nr:Chondroitinase-B precursor [Planctomycetes bacterium K23_9]